MAVFYQDPNPTSDPSYLSSSKEPDRIQGDVSMGKLFEGIGETTNLAGKAVKSIFEDHIKKDARELIEPIRAEHGLTDLESIKEIAGTGAKGRVRLAQMQRGAGAYDPVAADDATSTPAIPFGPEDAQTQQAIGLFDSVTRNDPARKLPPAAEKEIRNMSRMEQAYRAGNLSDSYYFGQLDQVTSKLRARYQGWEDEIDQAVSGITGVTPANAIRRSLLADIQANQAAALAGANSDEKWREKHRGTIAAIGYDPDKTPIETLKPAVSQWLGTQEMLKAKTLAANAGSPEAESALSSTMSNIVRGSVVAYSNGAQGDNTAAEFQKKAAEMSVNGLPKADQDQWVAALELRKMKTSEEMDRVAYTPNPDDKGQTMVSKLPGGDAKYREIKATQLKLWDDRIAMVKSGSYSALERSTAAIKEQDNLAVLAFRKNFPQAIVASTIANAFPNNPYMQGQFLTSTSIVTDWQKALKNDIGNAIINGSSTTPAPTPSQATGAYGLDKPKDAAEKAAQTAAYNDTRKQYDMIISPENRNVSNAAHVAKQFFGDRKFYEDLDANGRMKVFTQFASPEKTAFINTLAAKDPSIKQAYQSWALYAAGDIWRRSGANLQQILTDKNFDIQYNADGNYFYDNTKYSKGNGSAFVPVRSVEQTAVNTAVTSVNNVISMLKPIVGNDPGKFLPALGIDMKAPKEDFFTEKMWKKLKDSVTEWKEERERAAIVSGTSSNPR